MKRSRIHFFIWMLYLPAILSANLIFSGVKDPEGIAIDLGSSGGKSAIELSEHFYFVVAADPDLESSRQFSENLMKSRKVNVTRCSNLIAQTRDLVFFGPRDGMISTAKDKPDNPSDYLLRPITFKQLLFDYVYSKEAFKDRNVSFINCEMNGAEENILEDLLHFAYNNGVKVCVNFRLDQWSRNKIVDLEYLFRFFIIDCPSEDQTPQGISEYLVNNPSATLLFDPRKDGGQLGGQLFKKNMTAVIIGFNQLTYIRGMVNQLEKYTKDIIVVDNNSEYSPLLDYYENDFKYTLLDLDVNYGHEVYLKDFVRKLTGDVFIVTDPDLEFNPNLPSNFINIMVSVSNYYQMGRVGFALFIDSDEIRTDCLHGPYTIKEWESTFWKNETVCPDQPNLKIYRAEIDTTFSLFNTRYKPPNFGHRIAGDFTCIHLPWMVNFRDRLLPGEYEIYAEQSPSTSTNWFKERPRSSP